MKAFIEKHIGGDRVIWAVLILLSLISIIVVYSATGSLAYKKYQGNTFSLLFQQVTFSILGLVTVFFVHKFSYRLFMRLAPWAYLLGLGALGATLVMGVTLNAGSRWLVIGGISIQPSEFAKIALMMLLARELAIFQRGESDEKSAFLKMLTYIVVMVALIFPENFSTAAMVFAVSMALMFIGRISLSYIFATIGAGLVFVILILFLSTYIPQL
ncbi:MAG: FtsW/RodA/SpoVE family cell cycle protein, partial [Breznakibacter sp.]|nr:FtsW/RodA/SpoVE family cell cycle protein [Breznakibacter sp.]